MPVSPAYALVDYFIKLNENESDFRAELDYLMSEMPGTPLSDFLKILQEPDRNEQLIKLSDFFSKECIGFYKGEDAQLLLIRGGKYKFGHLENNQHIQIMLNLYCYACRKYKDELNDIYDKTKHPLTVQELEKVELRLKEMKGEIKIDDFNPIKKNSDANLVKLKKLLKIVDDEIQNENGIGINMKQRLNEAVLQCQLEASKNNIDNLINAIRVAIPYVGIKEVEASLKKIELAGLNEPAWSTISNLSLNDSVRVLLENAVKRQINSNTLKKYINFYGQDHKFRKDEIDGLVNIIDGIAGTVDTEEIEADLLPKIDLTILDEEAKSYIDNLDDSSKAKMILKNTTRVREYLNALNEAVKKYNEIESPTEEDFKEVAGKIEEIAQKIGTKDFDAGVKELLINRCRRVFEMYIKDSSEENFKSLANAISIVTPCVGNEGVMAFLSEFDFSKNYKDCKRNIDIVNKVGWGARGKKIKNILERKLEQDAKPYYKEELRSLVEKELLNDDFSSLERMREINDRIKGFEYVDLIEKRLIAQELLMKFVDKAIVNYKESPVKENFEHLINVVQVLFVNLDVKALEKALDKIDFSHLGKDENGNSIEKELINKLSSASAKIILNKKMVKSVGYPLRSNLDKYVSFLYKEMDGGRYLATAEFEPLIDMIKDVIPYFSVNDVCTDKVKGLLQKYAEMAISNYKRNPTTDELKSLIDAVEKVTPYLDEKAMRKSLIGVDLSNLDKEKINLIKNNPIFMEKGKTDVLIKEAERILKRNPKSQAAQDMSLEIFRLVTKGEKANLQIVCENVVNNYEGENIEKYKKDILKLCSSKMRNEISGILNKSLQASNGPVGRPESVLFSHGNVPNVQPNADPLTEARQILTRSQKDAVKFVNDDFGLASLHFKECIGHVKKIRKDEYRADSMANDPYVKAGDLIAEYASVDPNRDQIVIDAIARYFYEINGNLHERDATLLYRMTDIICEYPKLIGQISELIKNLKTYLSKPDEYKSNVNSWVTVYRMIYNDAKAVILRGNNPELAEQLEAANKKVEEVIKNLTPKFGLDVHIEDESRQHNHIAPN